MTVIAYNNGVMYSDRLQYTQDGNDITRLQEHSKLFVNKERTIAFCYTGLDVNTEALDSIFFTFYKLLELNNRLSKITTAFEFCNDEMVEAVLKLFSRRFIMFSKDQAYYISSERTFMLDGNDLITGGIDGNFFKALCLTGMDCNLIIPHIRNNISKNVSSTFDSFKQKSLKPLVFITNQLEPDIAITKYKEKISKIGDKK